MSRIYEALQQAFLEKNFEPGRSPDAPGEPPQVLEFIAEPSPVPADFSAEEPVKHPWSPSVDAVPCLLERGLVVEQFRSLRSRLMDARQEWAIKTLLISSGMPSEGKSFVALNFAVSLVRDSANRVLLIDGDLRRPTLHESLAAPRQPGLSEYLAGTAGISEILQQNGTQDPLLDGISKLAFIPAGAPIDSSSGLLAGARMKDLITSLAPRFDWIIIDSPPVLAVADAVDLARVADAVLLVAREARTPFKVAQRAQAAFKQSRILGMVLNASINAHRKKYYSYSSYYTSYSGESGSEGREASHKETRSTP
jgi:protein-tyrosine kinase